MTFKNKRSIIQNSFVFLLLLLIGLGIGLVAGRNRILDYAQNTFNESIPGNLTLKNKRVTLLSDFPIVSFSCEDISMVNHLHKLDTIFKADSLHLSVDVLSLLPSSSAFCVESISLYKPNLVLAIDHTGYSNFNTFLGTSANDSTVIDTLENTNSLSVFKSFPIEIKKSKFYDLNLKLKDDLTSIRTTIEHTNFSLSGELNSKQVQLSMQLDSSNVNLFQNHDIILNDGDLATDVSIRLLGDENKLFIDESVVHYNQLTVPLVGSVKILDSKHYDLDFAINSNQMELSEIMNLVHVNKLNDKIEAKGLASFSATINGALNLDTIMLPQTKIDIQLRDGFIQHNRDTLQTLDSINIDLKVKNYGGGQGKLEIDIDQFGFSMLDQRLDAKLAGEIRKGKSLLQGYLNSNLDLGTLSKILNFPTPISGFLNIDFKFELDEEKIIAHNFSEIMADGYIQVDSLQIRNLASSSKPSIEKLDMSLTPEKATIKNLYVTAGESNLHLTGEIDNFLDYFFSGQLMEVNLNLHSDTINYNQIYPAISEIQETIWNDLNAKIEKMSTAGDLSDAEKEAVMSAVMIPENLSLRFNSNFKNVIIADDIIKDANGIIEISDRTLQFEDLNMNFLDSKLTLQGSYESVSADSIIVYGLIDAKKIQVDKLVRFIDKRFPDFQLDSIQMGGMVDANMSLAAIADHSYNLLPETLQLLLFADGEQLLIGDLQNILEIDRISTTVVMNETELNIDTFEGDLFNGKIEGQANVVFGDSIRNSSNFTVDLLDVDIKKAYASMSKNMEVVPDDFNLDGKISLHFNANANLDSLFQIEPNSVKAKGNVVSDKLNLRRTESLENLLDSLHIPFYKTFELTENRVNFHIEDRIFHIDPSKIRFNKYLAIAEGNFDRYGNIFMGALLDIRKGDLPSDDLFEQYESTTDTLSVIAQPKDKKKKKKNRRTLKSGAVVYGNFDEIDYDILIKLNRDDSYLLMKKEMEEHSDRKYDPLKIYSDSISSNPFLFFL